MGRTKPHGTSSSKQNELSPCKTWRYRVLLEFLQEVESRSRTILEIDPLETWPSLFMVWVQLIWPISSSELAMLLG